MKVLVTGRQYGKTAAALEWVMAANKIDEYPGWDRVLVTADEFTATRLRQRVRAEHDGDPMDVAHRIYSVRDWASRNRGRTPLRTRIEVRVDDAEQIINNALGWDSNLTGITITGEPWETS